MLINITYLDDLPDVEKKLRQVASIWECEFLNLVNPTLEDLYEYSNEVKCIFCNPNKISFRFDGKFFKRFASLEYICTASTGTVHIDLEEANIHDVKVVSIKKDQDILKYITSTADLALNLALIGIRKSYQSTNDFFLNGTWDFERYIGKQIKDLKVCIFGYGRLGKMMSKYLTDLGANVDIFDPLLVFDFDKEVKSLFLNLEAYDLISFHLHAEGNENLFAANFFHALKDDVVIVNTSRGEIVNQDECLKFLRNNPRATYLTDVITNEFSESVREELIGFASQNNNLIVTQHIGGMSTGARKIAFNRAVDKLLEEVVICES